MTKLEKFILSGVLIAGICGIYGKTETLNINSELPNVLKHEIDAGKRAQHQLTGVEGYLKSLPKHISSDDLNTNDEYIASTKNFGRGVGQISKKEALDMMLHAYHHQNESDEFTIIITNIDEKGEKESYSDFSEIEEEVAKTILGNGMSISRLSHLYNNNNERNRHQLTSKDLDTLKNFLKKVDIIGENEGKDININQGKRLKHEFERMDKLNDYSIPYYDFKNEMLSKSGILVIKNDKEFSEKEAKAIMALAFEKRFDSDVRSTLESTGFIGHNSLKQNFHNFEKSEVVAKDIDLKSHYSTDVTKALIQYYKNEKERLSDGKKLKSPTKFAKVKNYLTFVSIIGKNDGKKPTKEQLQKIAKTLKEHGYLVILKDNLPIKDLRLAKTLQNMIER